MSLFHNNKKNNQERSSLVNWFKGHKKRRPKKSKRTVRKPRFKGLKRKKKVAPVKPKRSRQTLRFKLSNKEIRRNEDPNEVLRHRKERALHDKLTFPASWITSGNELSWYTDMGIKPAEIQKNSKIIFAGMAIMFLGPVIIGFNNPKMWLLGLVLALAVWGIKYSQIHSDHKNYSFNNELLFNNFLQILDLSDLKRGRSINGLLSRAEKRFKNKKLRDGIATLNSRVADNPTSSQPYLDFAHEFSSTSLAELFMLSVYRMSRGYFDDSQIKKLKDSVSQKLGHESHTLAQKKVNRFDKLQREEFLEFVLWTIIFLMMFGVMLMLKLVKGAGI